ncbi:MAG: hypothetical protein H8D23_05650, partial [Candidatus Brocadiales bacterium]|nr:hypothetical protein [Candidatus Brocadiales bacterium]
VDLSKNITIVYLSHKKEKPSKTSKSHIGFEMVKDPDKKHLKWNDADGFCKSELQLELITGTKFQYIHMDYIHKLKKWVIACKQWLVTSHPNNSDLLHAFEEYGKIIKRLDPSVSWRKIDSLASYTLLLDDSVQKDMYMAMVDAQTGVENHELIKDSRDMKYGLNEYVILKLILEIDLLFPENEYERKSVILVTAGKEIKLELLATANLRKWINEKGIKKDWKNIGFTIDDGGNKFTLCFGQKYLYFGKGDNDIFHEYKRVGTKGKNHKKNWLKNKKLLDFIAELKEKKSLLMPGPI